MAYKTCENCGERIFEYGCVNCNESDYIEMQGVYDSPVEPTDPRDNPLIGEDDWIHDADMGAR